MPAASAAPTKTNGVLAVNSSQTNAGGGGRSSKRKAVATGKKVVVRRLAPGMTEEEFWACLGDDWKSGHGKVDWTRWESGKISKDPFKPSKPSRCYLRILKLEDVPVLSETVRSKTWEDSKNTWNDSCLVGPVYVEVAQIQKVAASKRRTDPRQGTIDQDPDFIAFLESLDKSQNAEKQSKEVENGDAAVEDTPKEAKVTITPLVQYLKDKKANKAKEAANAKSAKHGRQEPAGTKGKGQEESSKKKGKDSKNESKDKEKPKEPVKLLTKKAAQQEAAEAAKAVAASKTAAETKPAEQKEEATPKSRRAGIAAAAKILQRDLGLSPGSAHRRARQDAAKAETSNKTEIAVKSSKDSKDSTPASTSSTPAKPTTPTPATAASSSRNSESQPSTPKSQANETPRRARGKGGKQTASGTDSAKGKEVASNNSKPAATPPTPIILKREENLKPATPAATAASSSTSAVAPASQTPPSTVSKGGANGKASKGSNQLSQRKSATQPSATTTVARGFIKHANVSQGITEALLKQTMETYGPVTFVEIDKRKGFAYVDFCNQESLAKAMAASPITVAQGSIQVLERKDNGKKAATPATPTTPAAASSSASAAGPASQPSPSTKAASEDKGSTEKPAAEGQSERPKRGGRGRGRKGGGNGGNSAGGTNAKAGASDGKAAPAQPSTSASTSQKAG